MEIALNKAKAEKLFYFVATGVVYRESDQRCLILKRSPKEKVHPGKWSTVGGKLEWSDLQSNPPDFTSNHILAWWDSMAERLVKREAIEEAGVKVDNVRYLSSGVFIRPDNIPVVCLKFATKYISGKVKIAPEFDDFAWVNSEELSSYDHIGGLEIEIAQAINIYHQ